MEMAAQSKAPNLDLFDAYFRRADLDRDGRISGAEAVSFFQGSGLPKQVLAQIWMHADQHRIGFLGRAEFYNALKLVTVAQSKRELTSDIVKAALYSPASAKIPAPQINLAVVPSPAPAAMVAANAVASTQISGFQGPQVSMGASTNQHHMPNQLMRHPQSSSESTIRPVQGMVVQGFPVGGPIVGPHSPVTSTPNDLSGDGMGGAPRQTSFQASSSGPDTSTSKYESGLVASGFTVAKPPRPREIPGTVLSGHPITDFKATGVSGNGFAIDATFAGDAVSVMPSQERQEFSVPSFSAVSTPVSSGLLPPSAGVRPPLKSSLLDSFQTAPTMQPVGGQQQSSQFFMQQNHQVSTQGTSSFASAKTSLGVENSASIQSQLPWPKMTQTDFQKYTKVFVEVDTDRDGKIAGEQARNLFLSWRLPREVLKQVWDLSDQDNDSMLSLREFCIALYLMERYREGRPLPAALPSSLMIDFPTTVQSTTRYGNAAWRPTAGWQQHQGTSGPTARQGASSAGARPPLPPSPQAADGKQAVQPKHRVPVLENHLVDQLSKEEQESLKSKFQDATEADKKVEELEKEILDSKQKIEFYRAKMQELVLYKSRCDNRLNEFMERVSVDRHEVELFAKKYEEKYKQVGGVVSNLTSEEATFRDIQEKKIELYQAIVKMEEDGNADGALQARADNIQSELDGLVKSVNERCKKYGLLLKPTTLVELPFGWQPGIQEGAADWDEDWDMFKDEGFTFVKELTLDVQNVVAPPKPKSRLAKKDKLSNVGSSRITASSSTNVKSEDSEMKSDSMDGNSENTEIGPVKSSTSTVQIHENGSVHIQGEYDTRRSTADTPIESGVTGGPFRELSDSSFHKSPDVSSLHATEAQSDPVGSEAFSSSDKATFDEPAWGTFDNDDVSSVWGFDSTRRTKEMDRESQTENYFFGSGDFGLAPIRTGSSQADRFFHNPSSIFADSVPSTPLHSSGNQTKTDSLYSDRLFQRMGPFGFADSVPSTPLSRLGNSPPRFSDASGHSFDAFSRLDSFDTRGAREPLSRFDSMSSNRDFDHNRELARFDSMHSTKDFNYSGGFPLFDDSDPFGSSGGRFKTSLESQTPRGSTDNWKAF